MGLAWDPSKNDTIIVMDSSLGVLELNVKTKKLKRVIFNNEEVGREVTSTVLTPKLSQMLLTQNNFILESKRTKVSQLRCCG